MDEKKIVPVYAKMILILCNVSGHLLFTILVLNTCVDVKNCHKCMSIEVSTSEGQFFLQTSLVFF